MLCFGLVLFGLGEAMLVAANIGVSPWTVFAQGLGIQTGRSLGLATFLTSVMVLLLWVPLKTRPAIGTLANAVIIALMLHYALPYLPNPQTLLGQLVMTLLGTLITGLGGAIYLVANLGPGPRDGLMTGINQLTNWPIAKVRGGLEISVVLVGLLLGGTAGVGTLIFAVGIGPAVALGLVLCEGLFRPGSTPTPS